MKINIQSIKTIADFPSGSGLVKHQEKYYAIGDDSPFLYIIDEDFSVKEKISIIEVDAENFKGNRIKKKHKPDFETLEKVSENEIITLGSGSKLPLRGVFTRIFLGEVISYETYSLPIFYEKIEKLPELAENELNIEAVAFSEGFLYLFNRKNNLILKFDYQQFIDYIKGEKPFPKIQTKQVQLPEIDGIEAGFSGATRLSSSEIIFTASVENTKNSYDDGKILGSLVGIIDISDFENASVSDFSWVGDPKNLLKIESVTLASYQNPQNFEAVFITDDDNGNTEMLKVSIQR